MSPYLIDRHSRESGNPEPSGAYGISMDTRFRGYDEDDEWDFCASITTGDIAISEEDASLIVGGFPWIASDAFTLGSSIALRPASKRDPGVAAQEVDKRVLLRRSAPEDQAQPKEFEYQI